MAQEEREGKERRGKEREGKEGIVCDAVSCQRMQRRGEKGRRGKQGKERDADPHLHREILPDGPVSIPKKLVHFLQRHPPSPSPCGELFVGHSVVRPPHYGAEVAHGSLKCEGRSQAVGKAVLLRDGARKPFYDEALRPHPRLGGVGELQLVKVVRAKAHGDLCGRAHPLARPHHPLPFLSPPLSPPLALPSFPLLPPPPRGMGREGEGEGAGKE